MWEFLLPKLSHFSIVAAQTGEIFDHDAVDPL